MGIAMQVSAIQLAFHAALPSADQPGQTWGSLHPCLLQRPLLEFQKAKLAFEEKLCSVGDITYSIVRPTAFFKSLAGQVCGAVMQHVRPQGAQRGGVRAGWHTGGASQVGPARISPALTGGARQAGQALRVLRRRHAGLLQAHKRGRPGRLHRRLRGPGAQRAPGLGVPGQGWLLLGGGLSPDGRGCDAGAPPLPPHRRTTR